VQAYGGFGFAREFAADGTPGQVEVLYCDSNTDGSGPEQERTRSGLAATPWLVLLGLAGFFRRLEPGGHASQ